MYNYCSQGYATDFRIPACDIYFTTLEINYFSF